jgi:DNA-directed RNA polymerase specialized sigma24 family protein
MPEDNITNDSSLDSLQSQDEALLKTLLSDSSEETKDDVLNTILERYYNPLKYHIYKHRLSWNPDPVFIDEVIDQTVVKVIWAVKKGKFIPRTIGLFKAFLFETCKRTCWEMNRTEKRQMKTVSEVFTNKLPDGSESSMPEGIPEDVMTKRNMDVDDFDYLRIKLKKILPYLNQEKQRLLELAGKGKKYKQITGKDKILGNYSVDDLAKMMYIIKIKLRELK